MKAQQISRRGLLFSFKDPFLTNVYVILGDEHVYVLDTFLGLDSMEPIKQEIEKRGYRNKPVVIFNSHGDYDHYWGNGAFENALIIGHEKCRERILNEHEEALQTNEEQKKGEVILKAPTLVFTERLSFPNDGVTFFHTPGHTIDSASCLDENYRILFVGDNVEPPLPYVYNTDITQFYTTLMSYTEIDWDVMIASHAPPLTDRQLLTRNIDYLQNLKDWKTDLRRLSKDELHLHAHNIEYLEEHLDKTSLSKKARQHIEEMKIVKLH